MKLCKNCAHGKRDWLLGWSFAQCYATQNVEQSPVHGRIKLKRYKYCEVQRIPGPDCCGPGAEWFAPARQTLWRRVVAWAERIKGAA